MIRGVISSQNRQKNYPSFLTRMKKKHKKLGFPENMKGEEGVGSFLICFLWRSNLFVF